ncbi:uncharacterized protein EI90DRAFT_3065194, partial [Cantharellus anzutake]|uniref:uncharacterized protein n=1 Tax=Cantharellus anzutake TaxID=1750568 RepID=UPI0019036304
MHDSTVASPRHLMDWKQCVIPIPEERHHHLVQIHSPQPHLGVGLPPLNGCDGSASSCYRVVLVSAKDDASRRVSPVTRSGDRDTRPARTRIGLSHKMLILVATATRIYC